jgi:hypothetical protein
MDCELVKSDVVSISALCSKQVLTNVNGSARLTWRKWHQFNSVGKGAVNVEKGVFVAREWVVYEEVQKGAYIIVFVDFKEVEFNRK